ncbi:variable large family protein [Borrelia hermsii]|uniref:variable large family protein n=1 Tax=Borrelia hermsii TaxID=140 RepID=UPI00214F7909|nr:variable large family protein [Borrelia hermsii]
MQAMIKDNGDAVKFAKNNNGAFNATGRPKDATITGGIALKAMAKGSNVNDSTDDQEIIATEIKGITVSAATKSSDTHYCNKENN